MKEIKNLICISQKTLLNETIKNDVFMELDILLLKNEPNLNQYWFQESFIDEIVNNQQDYIGIPLVCDTSKLFKEDFYSLGHNFSPITGLFYTEQIGSYYKFEKKYDDNGIAELHGSARISKRNVDLVNILMSMYNSIGLSFSVEVIAQDWSIDQNNNLIIPASPKNKLTADALVSFPACEASQALSLVAELNKAFNIQKGGIQSMAEFDANKIIDDNKALILENEGLKKEANTLKIEKEALVSEKEAIVAEKAEIEVKLNEANEIVISLGKEKETLIAQVEDLTRFKNEIEEKEVNTKIESLISDVKDELGEEEIKEVNEIAETKDVEKVEFKINEILASKYKSEIKLSNSKDDNFFSVTPTKSLGNDELSKFNM